MTQLTQCCCSAASVAAQSIATSSAVLSIAFLLTPPTAGQSLSPANNGSFVVQMNGNGTAQPTSGDSYTVTYTAGGQSFT